MIDIRQGFVCTYRFKVVVGVVCLAFVCLYGKLIHLHVVSSDFLKSHAQSRRIRHETFVARRGDILDRKGNLLATTRTVYDIGLDPDPSLITPREADAIREIAPLIGMTEAALAEVFRQRSNPAFVKNRRWIELAENVDDQTYRKIAEALSRFRLKALYGNRKELRDYPSGSSCAHVIGFQNETGYAFGIEHSMNYYLQGEDGWIQSPVDGRRREIARFRERDIKPSPGMNVQLTIDLGIQYIVEEEMRRIDREYKPESASIIVSYVHSGEILALANTPSFDPNEYWRYPASCFRNRAMVDVFEPGSTFKIVPIAMALDRGIVSTGTIYNCETPTILLKGKKRRLPTDTHRMKLATVEEILYHSSNRGSVRIAVDLGEQRLYEAAKAFGFGSKTGLCLTGEFKALEGWNGSTGELGGSLRPVSRWDGLTITNLPIGHALNGTALQVHQAMNVIASGGLLIRPKLISAAFSPETGERILFGSPAPVRVISEDAARKVARILQKVVGPSGTANRARIEGYDAAGKTGTTKKIVNGNYVDTAHVASFTGFFPGWDPQIMITVVVNEPRMPKGQTGYGGVVAGPVFKSIGEKIIQYLGIPDKALIPLSVAADGVSNTAHP